MKISLKELNIEISEVGWKLWAVVALLLTVLLIAQFPVAVGVLKALLPLFS